MDKPPLLKAVEHFFGYTLQGTLSPDGNPKNITMHVPKWMLDELAEAMQAEYKRLENDRLRERVRVLEDGLKQLAGNFVASPRHFAQELLDSKKV